MSESYNPFGRPQIGEDHQDPTEDWGGRSDDVPRLGTITLDRIPVVGGRRGAIEVSERAMRFGVALLIAASIYGGAEASAQTDGRHFHDLVINRVQMVLDEWGEDSSHQRTPGPKRY